MIAPQWVVTAKHCTPKRYSAKVRVGSNDYTSGGTVVTVAARYGSPTGDVGLLKLSSPVSYAPVTIAPSTPAVGAAIKLMGWGVTSENGDSSKLLKELNTTVAADSKCVADKIEGPIEVCVNVTTAATACYGDSGGPALVNGMLVGADSRGGYNCGDTGGEIYGDVTAQRSWIRSVTGV